LKDALEILLLIVVANATPVIARIVFSHRANLAIDFGIRLKDRHYLFGQTKTWRGLLSSILITSLVASVLGYDYLTGLSIASLAMSGDLLSSFIKRRLKKPSSSRVFLLDQLPESLLPAFFAMQYADMSLIRVIAIIISFIIIEMVLSALLLHYSTRQRRHD